MNATGRGANLMPKAFANKASKTRKKSNLINACGTIIIKTKPEELYNAFPRSALVGAFYEPRTSIIAK